MNNDTIVEVDEISKTFKVYPSTLAILKEWARFGSRSYHRDYHALTNVSFRIQRGEFVGIIGQNGAGKSTLLRIITDVLRPSSGSYKINGRVLSILELSGGADQELTGRENVVRSGQLLNLPDGYIQERINAIKDFSELDDYFDQPLRMYSTGMRTRLAFSMFAFLDTELLILDEVLAVGDIFFKQKCFARLTELIENKTSIVLVTHSMGIIQRYCQRVIVLDKGKKIFDGDSGEAIRIYTQLRGVQNAKIVESLSLDEEFSPLDTPFSQAVTRTQPQNASGQTSWPQDNSFNFTSFPKLKGKNHANLIRIAVLGSSGIPTLTFTQGEQLNLYCEFQLKTDVEIPVVDIEIRDKFNLLVHSKSSIQNAASAPSSIPRGSIIRYSQSIRLNIAPESYVVNMSCFSLSVDDYEKLGTVGYRVTSKRMDVVWKLDQAFAMTVLLRHGEQVDLFHGGLCDLPGNSTFYVGNGN